MQKMFCCVRFEYSCDTMLKKDHCVDRSVDYGIDTQN